LTAGQSRSTSKVLRGPILKPAISSGKATSLARPFQRLATAINVGLKASGSSPRSSLTAAARISGSTVVTEEDLFALLDLLEWSFLQKPGTHVFYFFLMGSFVMCCTATACF
jgi:hypothetical protein